MDDATVLQRSGATGHAGSLQGQSLPGRRISHPGRNLALVGAILVLALLAGAAWMVLDRRDADLAAAEHETTSLAVALAEQTSRTFGGVDFVLRDLQRRIDAAGIASPEALAVSMGTPETQQMLSDEVAVLSQIAVVGIVGADGRLISFSRRWPIPEVNLADRAFFRALQAVPALGLVISDPIAARVTGQLQIYLARRIATPDGQFLGVVMAAIRLDYFVDLYRSVSEGEGRIVALRRRDGRLLARYPEANGRLGVPLADDRLYEEIQRGASTAHALSASPADGIVRLRAAHALKDFPLVVVVAREKQSILAEWRRQSAVVGIGTALAACAFVAAIILLARQIARREASEATLTVTLDNVSQGILMVTADRHMPIYNRRVLEMLDLPPALMATNSRVEDVVRFQWERGEFGPVGGDVDDVVRKLFPSGGVSGEPQAYERRRPNGTVLEVTSLPLPGGGAVRTYTDITAVRQREAALQAALQARDNAEAAFPRHRETLEREMAERARPLAASEARHRDAAEVASDWIWETDAGLRFTFVSKRFGDTSGIAWAKLDGLGFWDMTALGFDPAGMDELRATIEARGVFQNVIHRVEPAGEVARFWRMSGKPFTDPATGAFAGYRGTGTDVTAAMEQEATLKAALLRAEAAEREARQARTWLADAIEALPEGIVLFDAEDRLVLCNSSYTEIYPRTADLMTPGIRFEDILRASAMRGEHILAGQDIEEWLTARLNRHHQPSGNREEQRLADGRWLQVNERHTSDGGTVGIRVDVTDARRREGVERDREKLAALGHLAGGVAHEINNLLQPAITFPQMVRDRLPPEDVESREDLDCVLESARKMREIVRNILLFARKEEPRLVPLDLVAELRAALGFLRDLVPPAVKVHEAGFDAHLGCLVAANKTQLTQVLTNLLVNAAQAIRGTGTVTVTVARTEPTEEEAGGLAIEAGRAYLAVSIADTGSGMDEATQARIFEPFFTTKPVGEGTGLGLSVAYGILRSWRGAITVRSVLGEGTTFVLTVPILSSGSGGG